MKILTPERKVFVGEADMIIARSIDGDIGIMPGHAPLVTMLRSGVFRVRAAGIVQRLAVHNGYLSVRDNTVLVLSEAAERAEEIDVDRALAAKRRAEERLARVQMEKIDAARAKAALERALSRLQAAGSD